jgi:hypothetical protein
LPDFTIFTAGLLTADFFAVLLAGLLGVFVTALATGLAGAFVSAIRAEAAGAAFAPPDGFDFATVFSTVFLDFATALAMADYNPKRGEKMRALHHFEGFRASCETPLSKSRSLQG